MTKTTVQPGDGLSPSERADAERIQRERNAEVQREQHGVGKPAAPLADSKDPPEEYKK